METITIINDGPEIPHGAKLDLEFNLSSDELIQIESFNNQYFVTLYWENLGPFESREKAIIAVCQYYFDDLEKYRDSIQEIASLCNKL